MSTEPREQPDGSPCTQAMQYLFLFTRHGERVLRLRPLPPTDGWNAGLDGRHALPLHLGSHGQTQGTPQTTKDNSLFSKEKIKEYCNDS